MMKRRQLCCFTSQPPLVLESDDDNDPVKIQTVLELEDWLGKLVRRKDPEEAAAAASTTQSSDESNNETNEFDDDATQQQQGAVGYLTKPEFSWLQISRASTVSSNTTSPVSVTGLLEEGHDGHSPVTVRRWRLCHDHDEKHPDNGVQDSQQPSCQCPFPDEDWSRITKRATAEHNVHEKGSSMYQSTLVLHVDWIDLRPSATCTSHSATTPSNNNNNQQEQGETILQATTTTTGTIWTQAATCHLLRSLLDCRHSASPWVVSESSQQQPQDDHPSVVILCCDSTQPHDSSLIPSLLDFRVSDACPSWCLHSICPNVCLENTASTSATSSTTATLLVYRHYPISGRPHLSRYHFVTGQPVPIPGCLWESYKVQSQDRIDDNDDHDDSPVATTTITTHIRITGPPYYNALQEYPSLLEPLLTPQALSILQSEAARIGQYQSWTAWPEQVHYTSTGGKPWTVFPLCYCFPAHDVSKRVWLPQTCALVPQTVALLQHGRLGDWVLRTALFSRLEAHSVLQAHTGWQDLANHVLRVHIPVVIPEGHLCGTWVDGCVATHQVGKALCFDDSKIHWAFNYADTERIVLIVDLVRPEGLPVGTATGGHSDELDQFIQNMKL